MNDETTDWTVAALEHLTGPSRGDVSWLTEASVDAHLTPARKLLVTKGKEGVENAPALARFRRVGNTYEVEAVDGFGLWVNGRPVKNAALRYGDVIEFGEIGPLSRFRLYDDAHKPGVTAAEIFGDVVSYVKTSRRPLHRKLGFALAELLRRLIRDTGAIFRAGVVIAITLLTVAIYQQYRADQQLRAQIESGNLQIDSVAAALTQARRDAIQPSDLKTLQEELGTRLSTNAERLQVLEARSGASPRVISEAVSSVAFIQGGYSLRHPQSKQMLRHVLSPDGVPVHLPNGQPYLSLDGEGPVAEVNFNGTGFVLKDEGFLITNRHVAVPWSTNPGVRLGGEGLEPVLTRLIAYFPAQPEPVDLHLIDISTSVDLAVLKMESHPAGVRGLVLAPRQIKPGEEVIVLGYPTGLMSLLAQSGTEFVQNLQKSGETGFWDVARRLAGANLIAPLASRGIVGQATTATIVYDAETTHGGSGGPVLNSNGAVVAVNTAIIPEFGGSNLGVPAAHVQALLDRLKGASQGAGTE